jgi:hypothetical protein
MNGERPEPPAPHLLAISSGQPEGPHRSQEQPVGLDPATPDEPYFRRAGPGRDDNLAYQSGWKLRLDQGIQIAKIVDMDFRRAVVQCWALTEEIVEIIFGAPSLWVMLLGTPEEVEKTLVQKQRQAQEQLLANERELSLRRAVRKSRQEKTP